MSMESIRIENMYDLNETIAAEIFDHLLFSLHLSQILMVFRT